MKTSFVYEKKKLSKTRAAIFFSIHFAFALRYSVCSILLSAPFAITRALRNQLPSQDFKVLESIVARNNLAIRVFLFLELYRVG